jgi:hypothetical protein
MRDHLRRVLLRREVITYAGWFGVAGFSVVALFQASYAILALVAFYWWPPVLPRFIRHVDFLLNTTAWAASLALLAFVSSRAARRARWAIWTVLAAAAVLSVFTLSVLLGLNRYDGGGILTDAVLKVGVYMLLLPFPLGGLGLFIVALIALDRQQQWNHPVAAAHPSHVVRADTPLSSQSLYGTTETGVTTQDSDARSTTGLRDEGPSPPHSVH